MLEILVKSYIIIIKKKLLFEYLSKIAQKLVLALVTFLLIAKIDEKNTLKPLN